MEIQRYGALIAAIGSLGLASSANGNVIFSQDFSSSSSVSSYYNVSSPGPAQWNSILGNSSITDGMLTFTRDGANASFTRSKDFTPAPQALIYKFDLQVRGNSTAQGSAATWQVGWGFSPSKNDLETSTRVHSRFALNLTSTPGSFTLRDNTDSQAFSGKQTITWVINNSATALQYRAPDGSQQSVSTDCWDLWVGNSPVFSDRAALTGGMPLSELKFAFTGGGGTIAMDNFSIDDTQPVPEPALTGTLAAAFLVLVVIRARGRAARALRDAELALPGQTR